MLREELFWRNQDRAAHTSSVASLWVIASRLFTNAGVFGFLSLTLEGEAVGDRSY